MMKTLSATFERFGGVMLLPVILALIAFLLIGRPSTWVTLTVAGLAMGMMIFLMASGLSLIFGLMDVLNFGHSAFVSFGAFIAASVLASLGVWVSGGSAVLNILALMAAIAAATAFGALAGWAFERVIVKPVYKDHLRQILITMGALIVADELIDAFDAAGGAVLLSGDIHAAFATRHSARTFELTTPAVSSTTLADILGREVDRDPATAEVGRRMVEQLDALIVHGDPGSPWRGPESTAWSSSTPTWARCARASCASPPRPTRRVFTSAPTACPADANTASRPARTPGRWWPARARSRRFVPHTGGAVRADGKGVAGAISPPPRIATARPAWTASDGRNAPSSKWPLSSGTRVTASAVARRNSAPINTRASGSRPSLRAASQSVAG